MRIFLPLKIFINSPPHLILFFSKLLPKISKILNNYCPPLTFYCAENIKLIPKSAKPKFLPKKKLFGLLWKKNSKNPIFYISLVQSTTNTTILFSLLFINLFQQIYAPLLKVSFQKGFLSMACFLVNVLVL